MTDSLVRVVENPAGCPLVVRRRAQRTRAAKTERFARSSPRWFVLWLVLRALLVHVWAVGKLVTGMALTAAGLVLIFQASTRPPLHTLAPYLFGLIRGADSASAGFFGWVVLGIGLVLLVPAVRWVSVPPPGAAGRVLAVAEAPGLFELIEAVRRALRVGRLTRVFLTDQTDASVREYDRWSRWGPLGWLGPRARDLSLGVPLLAALDKAELHAVISHELGHLSRRYSPWEVTTARAQLLLGRVPPPGQGRWIAGPTRRAAAWLRPGLDRAMLARRRMVELAVDRATIRCVPVAVAVSALLRHIAVQSQLGGWYWDERFAEAVASGCLPTQPWSSWRLGVEGGVAGAQVRRGVAGRLAWRGDVEDTHPTLRERVDRMLQAAGESPWSDAQLSAAVEAALQARPVSAWRELFELRAFDTVTRELDQLWAGNTARQWQPLWVQVRRDLGLPCAGAPLMPDMRDADRRDLDRIGALAHLRRFDEAATALRERLASNPGDGEAHALLAQVLADQGDAAAATHAQHAVRCAVDTTPRLVAPLQALHRNRGEADEAEAWAERGVAYGWARDRALAEVHTLYSRANWLPHGLTDEQLAAVRRGMALQPSLQRAYLVKVVSSRWPNVSSHLVLVTHRQSRWTPVRRSAHTAKMRDLLEMITLPGDCAMFSTHLVDWLGAALRRSPGHLVYDAREAGRRR